MLPDGLGSSGSVRWEVEVELVNGNKRAILVSKQCADLLRSALKKGMCSFHIRETDEEVTFFSVDHVALVQIRKHRVVVEQGEVRHLLT